MTYEKTVQSLVPSERWDVDYYYSSDAKPGKAYARFAAFTEVSSSDWLPACLTAIPAQPDDRSFSNAQGLDLFDASYFHMNKIEAIALDPQTRVLLHVTYEALHDSGDEASLQVMAPNTGTYVGCMFTDYMNLLRVTLGLEHTGPVMIGIVARVTRLMQPTKHLLYSNSAWLPQTRRKWGTLPIWPSGLCIRPAGAVQWD